MSGFNFSADQTYVNTSRPRLAGGEIHNVTFKEAKFDEIEGKKDDNKGMKYQVLDVMFENEQGYYTERIFNPKEKGDERRSSDWNGQTIISPSPNEMFGMFIGQFLSVINPAELKKLAGKSLSNNFEQIAKFVAKAANANKGVEVELKLMLAKDGSPRLPIYESLNRQDELYHSSNFIAKEGLFFTDKEKATITKMKNAVPSDTEKLVSARPATVAKPEVSIDDLDLDLS
jgi:hypothetical protein